MNDSDETLTVLPLVLQEMVMDFAFNIPMHAVLKSLQTVLCIIEMNLPFFFFREKIWSWHYNMFLPNPVFSFMPIEYYNGRFCELFDDDALYCLLLALDFRRKNVKMFGSRQRWLDRIVNSWRCVEPFAAYYKMLMRSNTRVMKLRGPLYTLFV